jgi:phosphoribosylformimino-5-aminoimidazole carboxamide ribotide isomerase
MMGGINIESTVKLAQSVTIPVIASGGIAGIDDIRELGKFSRDGIMGAVLGRALYEGALDFAECQRLADSFA